MLCTTVFVNFVANVVAAQAFESFTGSFLLKESETPFTVKLSVGNYKQFREKNDIPQ